MVFDGYVVDEIIVFVFLYDYYGLLGWIGLFVVLLIVFGFVILDYVWFGGGCVCNFEFFDVEFFGDILFGDGYDVLLMIEWVVDCVMVVLGVEVVGIM